MGFDLSCCPFCKSAAEAFVGEIGSFMEREAGIRCTSCPCKMAKEVGYMPLYSSIAGIHEAMAEAWNRRVEDA